MNRRDFLKRSAAASIAVAVVPGVVVTERCTLSVALDPVPPTMIRAELNGRIIYDINMAVDAFNQGLGRVESALASFEGRVQCIHFTDEP